MKVLRTDSFIKMSFNQTNRGTPGDVGDQPGFVNRDNNEQGVTIFNDPDNSDTASAIKKMWKQKKKLRKVKEEIPKASL
jgi:hypothetical protein